MRALSEVRVLCFKFSAFGVQMKEGYWLDLPEYRRTGWDFVILLDEFELEYWKSIGARHE